MLSFHMFATHHPFLLFSRPTVTTVPASPQSVSSTNSFTLTSLADPHQLTPFLSHVYRNIGGRGPQLSNPHSPFPTPYSLYPLFPLFSISCTLFCAHRNVNSFVFRSFRTLCTKQGGVGEGAPVRAPFGSPSVSVPTPLHGSRNTDHGLRVTSHDLSASRRRRPFRRKLKPCPRRAIFR